MFPSFLRSFEDLRNSVSNSPVGFAGILVLLAYIGTMKEKFEYAKEIYEIVMVVPIFFYRRIERGEKVKTLRRKQDRLNGKKHDYVIMLESEEREIRKTRRKEVDIWMNNVEEMDRDVEEIERNAVKWIYWLGLSLESSIERNLQEVDELLNFEFPDGLTLDVYQKTPFLTQALIDRDSDLEQISYWLNDPNVSRVGVYGEKGVGKTAILIQIQNMLSQSSNTSFEHVYWVSVEQSNVHKLQNSIAKQVGFDISDEEDTLKRKAKLHEALTKRGKCVIILDNVVKPIIEEIGIPNIANGCKLLLSAVLQSHCKRYCDRVLEVKRLSCKGSMELFRQKQRYCLEPKFEKIMELIVKECEGLALRLVNVAENLVGVDDFDEWNWVLRELREGTAS